MDIEKLNKKLAEWAGFSVRNEWYGGFQLFETPQKPSPDGVHFDKEEFEENWYNPISTDYFTDSLDACVKLLVPKLAEWSISSDEGEVLLYALIGYRDDNNMWSYFQAWAETPALALCLAISKLIEQDDKK